MTEDQFNAKVEHAAGRFEARIENAAGRLEHAVESGATRLNNAHRRHRAFFRTLSLVLSLALTACFFLVPGAPGKWLGALGLLSLVTNALQRLILR